MTAANLLTALLALGLVIGFGNATILLYLVGYLQRAAAARPGPRGAGRHRGSGRHGVVHLMAPDGAQPHCLCATARRSA